MAVTQYLLLATEHQGCDNMLSVELTMCSRSRDYAAHANCWRSLKQRSRDKLIGLGDRLATTSDGEDAVMNTLYNLADTGLDACCISEIRHVFAPFANNHASFLRRDEGSEGKLRDSILLVGSWRRLSVGTEACLTVVHLEMIHGRLEIVAVRRKGVPGRRHGVL